MKKFFVLHPFLFAMFPLLFLFSHNQEQTLFSEIVLPAAVILTVTFLLVISLKFIFKDKERAGLVVSLFLFLFFSYGHFCSLVKGVHFYIGSFSVGYNKIFFLPYCFLLVLCLRFIIKTKRKLHNVTNILNITLFSLMLVLLINIGVYTFKLEGAKRAVVKAGGQESSIIDSETSGVLRDIYYIIPDSYVAFSTLKDVYGYDNQEFIDYLTRKGFYIAFKSRCNYFNTQLSLASSLNMKYLNYISSLPAAESGLNDSTILYQMIEDNEIVKFLKAKGYKFINGGSAETPYTRHNRNADLNILTSYWDQYLGVLIQTTMLKPFLGKFLRDQGRQRILGSFAKLAEVVEMEGPKFVFAHISSPHVPYLFDADGNPVAGTNFKLYGYEGDNDKKFLNQLIFVTKKIMSLIDEILTKSRVSPIIIVQADQGPGSYYITPEGMTPGEAWKSNPTKPILRERFRILNVYYLPGGGDKVLYQSITPVNTFRLIFNFYFNANYELLDDQSYYSNDSALYKFINITEKVKYD